MPRGRSGRIVLVIDPLQKRRLYEALDQKGLTLKDWFLHQLNHFLEKELEPTLFSQNTEYES